MGPQAGEWRRPRRGDFQFAMATPLFGLIRVAHCAMRRAGQVSFARVPTIISAYGRRLVLGFSIPNSMARCGRRGGQGHCAE